MIFWSKFVIEGGYFCPKNLKSLDGIEIAGALKVSKFHGIKVCSYFFWWIENI